MRCAPRVMEYATLSAVCGTLQQASVAPPTSTVPPGAISVTTTGKPGAAAFLPSLIDGLAPTAHAQGYVQPDFAYDELWSEPRNLVGTPPNRVLDRGRTHNVLQRCD